MDSTGPDRPDAAAGSEAAADGDADGAAGAGTAAEAAAPGPSGGGSGGRISVGLVLSAGGAAAEAWHAGVVRALHEVTGWDARSADLMLGTSAGAITGLCLRAGIPPADLYAHRRGEPVSDEGQAVIDRVVTPYSEGRSERDWTEQGPQSPTLAARALWPPWQARPLHAAVGLLPRGTRTTEALQQRMAELHPQPWPADRFWVPVVRLSDGERVVLGRDDLQATAAEAVRASCAVPVLFEPVTVDGQRYIDGGLHSYTNADLMGPPAFDLVVVSSPMSGTAGWPAVRGSLSEAWASARSGVGLGEPRPRTAGRVWWSEALERAWDGGRAMRAARRQWVDDKLRAEVDGLRRRGVAVLVVEPDAGGVELVDSRGGEDFDRAGHDAERADGDDPLRAWRAGMAASADHAARRILTDRVNRRLAGLLRRAAG
ncbi:MAG: patatin-like phospholipase family protein [Acidimicrobiaceae bacterium]|nr:patatin-like phospholipase family protein [Acidimicrobiaceae bacterium]